jgi:hypothetical protein
MKTVTFEAEDRATILIADDDASNLRQLSGFRHFFKTLNALEKTHTIGGETRLVPVLR